MITQEECMDIWNLSRQGFSLRQIARKLGINRRTVKKYITGKETPSFQAKNRDSKLAPHYGVIDEWLGSEDYQATRIHELLRYQGYTGSYETVKRYVRTIKEERDRIAYTRFETMPGLQAQVDFGEFGLVNPAGGEQKLYCFVMVLGFSRHMYVEFVTECTMPVFLDCHIRAFAHFGGSPAEILYDNMKNVVIKHMVGKVAFNQTFKDFATHYQFKPLACPPHSPWCKGKVERPIHYLRERFWRGYVYWNLDKANEDVLTWVNTVAFDRIHGTTRQKVSERFTAEQPTLGPLPLRAYDTSEKYVRLVHRDCQISFAGNRYVVPHTCVGKRVLLKIKARMMQVYLDDQLQATYPVASGKGQLLNQPRFYEELRRNQEQLRRKYRYFGGKAKATIGLKKHTNYAVDVEVRNLAVYDRAAGGASCLN